jgi:hypothetical protein
VARKGARGGGRVGAVKGRSQTQNPKTGLFVATKKSGGSFKGVRKER